MDYGTPMPQLTPDQLLSTTRAVRKRLDFDRPVPRELIEECIALALQAPTASNSQPWTFVVVTDPAQKAALAQWYLKSYDDYSGARYDDAGGELDPATNWVCWGAPSDAFPWVRSDNEAGAALAVRHMLVRGYEKIVCIGSETSPQRQFKERYDGYAAAMRDAGREPVLQRIERGLAREEQGQRAAAALAESGQPFDAIFAVSDEIALGALKELSQRGYGIPDPIGIVGFDGVRAGAWSTPPLTTIESDFETAGALLVERLLASMAGEPETPRRVPVRLVVRGSTRP